MFWFGQILNEEVIFMCLAWYVGPEGQEFTLLWDGKGEQWGGGQCSRSVTKSCPTLCEPKNCSTPSSCPSLSPGVCSNSRPLSQQRCLTTHIYMVNPFSFCLQSFPAPGSFPMSQRTQKWEPQNSTGIMLSKTMWIWGWGKRKKCVWFIRR